MPGKDFIMNMTRRLFTKWMLLNMLQWFSRLGDDLGPLYALWTEDPDAARPFILRLLIRYPITGIRAIVDSLRYHYY